MNNADLVQLRSIQSDITYFKEDILKSIKVIENKLTQKISMQTTNMNDTLTSYNKNHPLGWFLLLYIMVAIKNAHNLQNNTWQRTHAYVIMTTPKRKNENWFWKLKSKSKRTGGNWITSPRFEKWKLKSIVWIFSAITGVKWITTPIEN